MFKNIIVKSNSFKSIFKGTLKFTASENQTKKYFVILEWYLYFLIFRILIIELNRNECLTTWNWLSFHGLFLKFPENVDNLKMHLEKN